MKTEILDLAKRLRQERLFVASEKQQLQELNEKVIRTVERLTHVSWISRQQRTNLDSLILGRLETSPGDCCKRAAILDDVNFVDAYKVLGYHESSYGEFLQYLRENPQTLAALLANAEKSGRSGEELHDISSIIMCSLYGNCVLRQDEEYALQLLKHLMEIQLTGAEDPGRLLRRESCAFSRLYKALSEGIFEAKLFLTAALHDPIIKLLMEDEQYLDADPLEMLERFTPQEKAEKFGQEPGEAYEAKVRAHRTQIVEKLAEMTTRFIDGIKGSSYCFPTCLSWVLRQVYQMMASSSSRRPSLSGDVLAPRATTEVDSVCVDLVFSFFVCPAIVNPEPYGIAADAYVTPVARHNLMQVAQVLQVLAMKRWDERIDPRQADLYAKFPKGVMTPFLDMVLNGPMDESAANGGMFTHLDGITRNGALILEHDLHMLVNFARHVRRTSCEGLDTKALDSLLNGLPVVAQQSPRDEQQQVQQGSPQQQRHEHQFGGVLNGSGDHGVGANGASGGSGMFRDGENVPTMFASGLKKNLINKVSMVKKKVSSSSIQDGQAGDDAMDHSGSSPSVDVLLVRFQQSTPDCPGMLTEQKFLALEEHNMEGQRMRHKHLHHGIPRIGNALVSESSLQSQEDEKESLASAGGASGLVGVASGSHEVLEKRTRFSLSQDDGSIGNTSDNLEAISEAASNHSVSSSLDMDENPEDQINYDNLSDMVSANVSGRGTPNVSGRDTPSSQVTEGDDAMVGNRPGLRGPPGGGPSVDDDTESVGRPSIAGLVRHGSLGVGDGRGMARPGSGQRPQQPNLGPGGNRGGMPGKQQSREDIQDKFGKFEIKSLLEGDRQRPNPTLESYFGDETVSLVSDTWSTDVLASDTETIPDPQGSHASAGAMGGNFSVASGLPAMLSVGQDPTRDFGPIGPHGVHPQPNPLLDVPESLDGVSEAWSTDVLASDSERMTEIDTDDAYSVAARSDDTARSEIEVDMENASSSDLRAGNRSPVDRWAQGAAFQRFRQGSTVSVTSSISSTSSALPPSRQGGISALLDSSLAQLEGPPPVSSSVPRSEAVVRFADEFGLQMATDMSARAGQDDRVGSSSGAAQRSPLSARLAAAASSSSANPVITVNGSGNSNSGSNDVMLIDFGSSNSSGANANGVEPDQASSFRLPSFSAEDSRMPGCDSVAGSNVAVAGSGSSFGSDSQEAMDVDDLASAKNRRGEVSSSDAPGAEGGNNGGAVDGNKVSKSISFDHSVERLDPPEDRTRDFRSSFTFNDAIQIEINNQTQSDGQWKESGVSSEEIGIGKSAKRGFFKGGFRLPFRGRNRKGRGGSGGVPPTGAAGVSNPGAFSNSGDVLPSNDPHFDDSSSVGSGAPSPRRTLNSDLLLSDQQAPSTSSARGQAESSDDILAKYRKKISSTGKPGGVDLPDSSSNNVSQSNAGQAGPSSGAVNNPAGNSASVEQNVDAAADQEVADLMNLGEENAGKEADDDSRSAFEDAKRKLRLVLSTADFQIFPHPPFAGVGEQNRAASNNGGDRTGKLSEDNELRGLLQLQLAEAINVGDRFLAAQIHEALRCISSLDGPTCVKLLKALKEDHKKRSPYIAYLIRSRQGLLSALSYLERLLSRVEKDQVVCSTFLVSVCASLFLEKNDRDVVEFKREFCRLNASDEKTEFVEQFLKRMNAELEKDAQWTSASEEQLILANAALERAVMSQIYVAAMFPNGDGDILRDQVLHEHMAKLGKIITPNHKALRIPKVYHLECPWMSAQAEISTINAYRTPRDKINCVCRCAKTIMTLLSIADDKAHSADDFIPVLVYVLIMANPKNMLSTIQYVNSFSAGIPLSGEEQYWWTQFASAVEFIKTID